MNNKLHLVNPFSCMEPILRNKYGNVIFFLTFWGAAFQFKLYECTEVILRKNIKELIIKTINKHIYEF